MSHREEIEWFAVSEQLPDDGITVLVSSESADVWLGYHDNGHWYAVDEAPLNDVSAWAHLPEGSHT